MATSVSLDFPSPDSWEELETIIADLARRELGDPLAVKHGRKGQGDEAVDVYARPGEDSYIGIQCKDTESLTRNEIESEVKDAREFEPGLDDYLIVWSGQRDKEKQETVRNISQDNVEAGYFRVHLWSWEEVCERLAHHPDLLETHFREQRDLYSKLRNGGFIRLSETHFENQRDYDLEDVWSAGLRPVDVREGYTIDRWMDVSDEDDEDPTWVSMTGELLHRLEEENIIVRGPPGSGKSAICLSVANQWYEQGKGAVFYRPSGASSGFPDGETLKRVIETAEGQVLVVVEDAVRDETRPIHQVIHEQAAEESVSFLLDGRYGESRDFNPSPAMDTTVGRQISFYDDISTVNLGSLNEHECKQLIDLYEAETDSEIAIKPEHLIRHVDSSGRAGDMLHVSYHLLQSESGETGLEADVRAKFDSLYNPDSKNAKQVQLRNYDRGLIMRSSVLINLLNLAGLPIRREFIQTLSEEMGKEYLFDEVESLVNDGLYGWITFGGRDDYQLTGRHEFWSFHFMRYLLHGDRNAETDAPVSEKTAKIWVTDCINAVIGVLEDDKLRSNLRTEVDMVDTREKKESSREMVDAFLGRIFHVGRKWPILATLFESSIDNQYAISEADICQDWILIRTIAYRGEAFRSYGKITKAANEFDNGLEIIGDVDSKHEKRMKSMLLQGKGEILHSRGKHLEAEEAFNQCIEIHNDIGDKAGEAATYTDLGQVYQNRGQLDEAEEAFERSLTIADELGNPIGKATALNNLGEVYRTRRLWEEAERKYKQSLSIIRKIGFREIEAAAINNLGLLYVAQEFWDQAQEMFERSLSIAQEIGDREGEARTLTNLAHLYHKQGKLDDAEEAYERSIVIQERIDDYQGRATTLNNLGQLYYEWGRRHKANNAYNQSLNISRDIGDKTGEATTLTNLGELYLDSRHLEYATEIYQRSLTISREVGDRHREAVSLFGLGRIHLVRQHWKLAEKNMQKSLEINREIDDEKGEIALLSNLGEVYSNLDKIQEAKDAFSKSLSKARKISDRQGVAKGLVNVGQIYVLRGNQEEAEEMFQDALEIHRETGNQQEEATVLMRAGQAFLGQDEYHKAHKHIEEAVSIFLNGVNLRKGLSSLLYLVDICEALNMPEKAIQHCERGIEILEKKPISNIGDIKHDFQEQYARLSGRNQQQAVKELYSAALQRVQKHDSKAAKLFGEVWERKEEVGCETNVYPLILASGVAFAAFPYIVDDPEKPISAVESDKHLESEMNPDRILNEIASESDILPLPAKAVFEKLHTGSTNTTPQGLRRLANYSTVTNPENPDTFPIAEATAEGFARLLEAIDISNY